MLQRRGFRDRIGKGNIAKLNVAGGALNHACTFVFLLLRIQNRKQRLTGRHAALELGVDVGQCGRISISMAENTALMEPAVSVAITEGKLAA